MPEIIELALRIRSVEDKMEFTPEIVGMIASRITLVEDNNYKYNFKCIWNLNIF